MKVTMKLAHQAGQGQGKPQMWDFDMKYHELPVNYAMEIATLAANFANYVKTTAGGSSGDTPAYEVEFEYDAMEAMPKGMDKDSEIAKLFKGKAKATTLLYSQAIGLQRAGWKMLDQLMESAEIEVAAGVRK